MKKIAILVSMLMIMMVSIAEAKGSKNHQKKENKKFEKIMKDFQMEAVMKTTKVDITFFLYPEAAPKNVANFVFLAKNDFYNGLKFFRVVPNGLVQGGDPAENGTWTTGYIIPDEKKKWLNFDVEGILAMSNSGPDTNSSQFFITMEAMKELNGKYTIIGGIKSREDLRVIRTLRENDKILSVDIKGKKVDNFLNYFPDEVSEWESKLKKPSNQ